MTFQKGELHPSWRGGITKHWAYKSYIDAKRRTSNPSHEDYPRYGGRGITMCEEWRNDPQAFLNYIDTIPRTPGQDSIDRIDNDRGYEPGNIRFASVLEQSRNKSSNIKYTRPSTGETLTQKEWADRLGISQTSLARRIKRECDLERALSTPGRPNSRRIIDRVNTNVEKLRGNYNESLDGLLPPAMIDVACETFLKKTRDDR